MSTTSAPEPARSFEHGRPVRTRNESRMGSSTGCDVASHRRLAAASRSHRLGPRVRSDWCVRAVSERVGVAANVGFPSARHVPPVKVLARVLARAHIKSRGTAAVSRPTHLAALLLTSLATATATVAFAGPASGKPTDTATLRCGAHSYTIDGFGRGQVLHVTGTNRGFIVTKAVRHTEDGDQVVFDNPSRADRDLVTCTTTTPGSDGTDFTFTGFFTPPAPEPLPRPYAAVPHEWGCRPCRRRRGRPDRPHGLSSPCPLRPRRHAGRPRPWARPG